jgi:hypothetical protein
MGDAIGDDEISRIEQRSFTHTLINEVRSRKIKSGNLFQVAGTRQPRFRHRRGPYA